MPLQLTLQKYETPFNPTAMYCTVAFSGSYVAGGDTLNLTPSTILDPGVRGVLGPNTVPRVAPGVLSENLGGYYAQVVPGATLSTFKLKVYSPGGAELAAGAYPAAITGGNLSLVIPFENF